MPDVPDRSTFDPVLGTWLHTGTHAVKAGTELPPGAPLATDIETPGLLNSFTINCVTMSWHAPDGVMHSILLDPRRDAGHAALVRDMYAAAGPIILQNSPFDIPPLHHAGLITMDGIDKIVDTAVLARMAEPSQIVSKKLAQLAKRYFGYDEGSMELAFKAAGFRTHDDGYEGMDIGSPVYRTGAMADTAVTLLLEPVLREAATAWTLDHSFPVYGATDRAAAAEIIAVQERVHRVMMRRSARGLAVDLDYLAAYREQVMDERERHLAALAEVGLLGGSGKGPKLVEYLDSIGELPENWPRTPTGKLRARKDDLDDLHHPLAVAQRQLAESDKVDGWMAKVVAQAAVTGRCHPQVLTLGASATGRMSYSAPELQQFSAAARPIITDDGQGLTSIDWSQIEPVTMALMARDEKFLTPFEAGADLYEPIQRSAGIDRPTAKVVLLAAMYGQGIAKLARTIQHTEESAQQIRRQMFAAMPRCERWMAMVQDIARDGGRVPTAAGRILPVDPGFEYKAVNYCLGLDELVLRADLTHVPAHTIQVGDELVGFDEHPLVEPGHTNSYRQLRTATVEAVSEVVKPSVIIVTADGCETLCSTDHLWIARRGRYLRWVRADELTVDDELLGLGRWETNTSRDGGYLAGLLDGEGCLSRRSEGVRKSCQIIFSQLGGAVMDTYRKLMDEQGFPYAYRPTGTTSTSPTDTCTTSGVRTAMRMVGSLRPERFVLRAKSIYEGRSITAGLAEAVSVVEVRDAGLHRLASIQTSTRTLVANGFLSHNCVQGSAYDVLAWTICQMDDQGLADHIQLALHDELVVDTEAAEDTRRIMETPPPFLIKWAERVPVLRTDTHDMGHQWLKV